MKKFLTFLALCCLVVTGAWAQASASTQKAAAEEVINDFMGTGSGLTVNVTIDPNMKVNGKDKFTYTLSGSTLNITASNGVSACRGFYDFTKSNGAGICSWSANRFKAPASPTTTSKTVTSPYRDHQYLNVVTYGYSMPYWDENRWDKEIAWMALHGIDMPLMLVGSETIYRDVFKALYSTSDAELDVWEVGPAHLPWMRMGNLAGNSFDGPLGDHWHSKQKALAKHILKKMGELGMKPVVPAFGGFVPPAVAQRLGNASTTGWGWVPNNYKNYRLTPTAGTGGQDGEFKKIGKKFIELWDQEYESSYGSQFKYYLSDSFNEMDVPFESATLQTYGEQIYGAIKEGSGNNDAVWVTQGWEFVYGSGKWTNGSTSDAKYKALTAGVPQGKFMSLYMSPEYGNGKWSSYDNFDGDDWVYTMLPNMGGKNFWTGNLQNYATTWPKSMANSGAASNCTGWGMTMEGIEYNEMLYELIADMGWTEPSTGKDLNNWVLEYGNARYGSDKYSQKFKNLHTTMRNTVYTSYIDHANFGWQGNNKSGGYYNAGNIGTTNDAFFEGFEAFFGDENIGELRTIAEGSGLDETMRADLIEFSAFYAAARVEKICKRITTANNTGNKTLANELITELDKVMTDMDYILTGHPIYDEAKWEAKARALAGSDVDTQKKYVKNARRIVTTWYGNHQSHEAVNDYASRIYAGIIRDYYLPRLKAELNQLVNGTACNLRDIERTFTPNGDVATDAPELSTPGYYLGNDEKTLVAGGMTSSNTSDAVLLANIQALVEEAREAGEIIIEKNNLTVSTDAATHWYFVNSNNPSYTDRSLTATEVDGVKSTVKAQTTEATNEQIWRFVDNHDGTVRMENRNGQTLTWENGTAKTYIASINAGMSYELDEANTRYALIPEGIGANKALHMNNANGVPEAYGYKDAGTTNYYSGSTWTLSKADGYIGVPSDEDFARITRRFQGFQTSVWGTGSYGSVGQPKSAAALQAAIDAVATRDLALATYTDYLATYDTALKTNFNLPTDAEALKLFDLIISAFQIDPNINCNTEDQATFKAALQAAQTALAGNATGNTATTAATTLEAAVKAFITNAASFPYVSKAPANGQFDEGSKVITMKVKKSGYITTDAVDGSQNFKLNNSTAPTTKAGYWIVSGNDSQGYSFYNVGAGATKVLGMTGSEGNARAKLYDVSSTSGVTTKFFYKKNQNGDHCFYISGNNAWNDRDSYLALWNDAKAFGTDNGSAIVIATVENVDLTPEEPGTESLPTDGSWTESSWVKANSSTPTSNFYECVNIDIPNVAVATAGDVTVTMTYKNGNHRQLLEGVELIDANGNVVAYDYHNGSTGGSHSQNTYTLNNVAAGTYTVRCWSNNRSDNDYIDCNGTITVAGAASATKNWSKQDWTNDNSLLVAAGLKALYTTRVGTNNYWHMDSERVTFTTDSEVEVTYTYTAGSERVDLIGVELLDASGNLVQTAGTYDGHAGYAGNPNKNNTYTLNVPAGTYTIRTWANYVRSISGTKGNISYTITAKEPEPTDSNPATDIRVTFTNSGSIWTDVGFTANATDADDNVVQGVTVSASGTSNPKNLNVGADKLGINYQTSGSGSLTLNFNISNLPAGSSFNCISLPMYAVNSGGNYQGPDAGTSHINVTVTVKEGETTLYTGTMQNFNITEQKNGNLNSGLVFNSDSPITITGTSATVSFTITKGTTNNGCYMALQSLNLTTEGEEPVTATYTLTPAAGNVEASDLATITLAFTGDFEGVTALTEDEMEDYVPTLTTADEGWAWIESFTMNDDGTFSICFDASDITDGEWTLTIPEGTFTTLDDNAQSVPVAEITATYNVSSAAPAEVVATLTINGVETNYYEGSDIVLNDGATGLTKVVIPNDVDDIDVAYTRTFTGNNATAWQAWYVPFRYTLTSEDVDAFDFAYIWTLGVDVKTGMATNIIYEDLVAGDVLKANTPYLIKAKAATTEPYEFKATGLCATEENHIDCSTTKFEYDFVGNYESFVLGEQPYYALDNSGAFAYTSSATYKLQPYRYYMYITEKKTNSILDPHSSSNVQKMTLIHRGENDEQTTSINTINRNDNRATTVDLTGRIVSNPRAGVFISNGKKCIIK